ncbi:MAG: hypothetical protein KDA84_02005, partial [Planctomycetaceae bacterium]|nr:hypothetical protein [Planctomycetaceae bacterium]
MHRLSSKFWIPVGLSLLCIAPAWASPQVNETNTKEKNPKQTEEKSPSQPEKSPALEKREATQFIRLRKNKEGKPVALETAIVRYVPESGDGGVSLDLIGAVHVGDLKYYKSLNKRFEKYDALLYELVAEKGTRIPKGGKPGGDMLPVEVMKSFLQLESQLVHIDYTKKNFVHADLSPKEMKAAMKKRGEDGLTLTLGIIRDVLREANKMEKAQAQNDAELPELTLSDFIFRSSAAVKMKRFMAVQLSSPQSMGAMGETLNQLLISDRNEAALKVFQTEMAKGKRKMALFYGAAHMPDF